MNLTCPNSLQAASRPPNTFRMDSLLEEMRYVESKYIWELGQNRVRNIDDDIYFLVPFILAGLIVRALFALKAIEGKP